MSPETYSYLLYKQQHEKLTPQEQQQLDDWLSQSPDHRQEAAETALLYRHSNETPPPVDIQAELSRLKRRIRTETSEAPLRVAHRRFPLAWAAAAAIALIAGAVLFFRPGGNTLPEMTAVTASATRPEYITLPDGSEVVLREGSTLQFAASFQDAPQRRVALTGEAFFKVSKDAGRPFIVSGGSCETTVLGTQFNVQTAPDASTVRVAVQEGRVQVSAPQGNPVVLEPGKQAVYSAQTQQIIVFSVAPETVGEWRNPALSFRRTPLTQVAERLGARFQTKINIDPSSPAARCEYSAYFPRAELKNVLDNLAAVFGISYQQLPDGAIQLSGGHCSDGK